MKNLTYYIYRCIFALACTLPLVSFAQQTISGIVSDENGLPLPGATVVIENSNRGTTTDFDGKYSIVVEITNEGNFRNSVGTFSNLAITISSLTSPNIRVYGPIL